MNKQEIISQMAAQLEANMHELTASLESYEEASNRDEGDTIDPDDVSKQAEYKEMQRRMQIQYDQVKSDLIRLRDLSVKDHTQAEAGALLETDRGWFFLGIPLAAIDVNGKELLGVSVESPAYATIKGMKAGDAFMLGKNEFVIQGIY
jgi:hypothetical protein